MSDDPRLQVKNQFVVSQGFDIYSNPSRLTPIRSFENMQDDGVTAATGMLQYEVQDFWPSSISGRLYGLGKQTSFSRPKVFYKTDPTDSAWTLPATAEGGALLVRGCFFEWAAAMWMFSGSTNVSKWVIGSTFTDTVATVGTINGVSQGLISPTDNCAYMFYYTTATTKSTVVRISSAGSVTDDVVPLPIGYRITSSCLWGNYIAIAMVTGGAGSANKSIVVLWDPTLSNFSDIIDFGDGEIKVIENVEGSITAMIDGTMSNSVSVTGGTFVVRMWGGGAVQTVKSIKNTTIITSGLFRQQKVLKDFRLYVAALLTFNGASYVGLWSFGRKGPGYPYAFTCSIYDSNANNSNGINGFANMGDYWYLAENSDGTLRKTNDQATYTDTITMESQKYTGGDIKQRKLLHSVFATTVPLPAAGQIVLKYRKDEETSYTTLFTETTDNNILTELGAASGVLLPEFKEIQFKIESTGFAEPTSWGFRFTTLDGATTPES